VGYNDPRHPEVDPLHEWEFRSGLDRYIWIWGMICAYIHPSFERALNWLDGINQSNAAVIRAAIVAGAPSAPYRAERESSESEGFRRDRSRGRFATPADSPRHDGSPYRRLRVRRWGLGFIRRSRAIFRLLRAPTRIVRFATSSPAVPPQPVKTTVRSPRKLDHCLVL
jgi:hypothetical protein